MEESKIIKISPDRSLIDSKWTLKKKRYGKFKALILALGQTQITGVYLTDNLSPLVTDTTLRIILIMWLINKLYHQTIYPKTSLLYT